MAAMELLCQTPSFRHARNARAGIDDHGQTSWNSSLPCGGDVQGQAEHRSTPMKHVQIVSTDSLGFIKCEEMTHHPAKASTRILSVYIYIPADRKLECRLGASGGRFSALGTG